jgi:hypothetical protein
MSILTTVKEKMDALPLWLRRALWAALGVLAAGVAAHYGFDVTGLAK